MTIPFAHDDRDPFEHEKSRQKRNPFRIVSGGVVACAMGIQWDAFGSIIVLRWTLMLYVSRTSSLD